MSTQEHAARVEGEVLSLDALRPLYVTEVAEFVFCERKGAFAAHHIPGDQMSPAFAVGTVEHELRHRVSRQMRNRYGTLSSPAQVERFKQDELLDVILRASRHVQDLACATHPLYIDQLQLHIRGHAEDALLHEELARATDYRVLLERGVSPSEGTDRVLPHDIERGLGSSRLRLKGRVDQVWRREGRSVPVDLKTHGPHLRKLFEESHWVQVALYALLLEEAGEPVAEVGLHYTHCAGPDFRPFDAELKARALAALRDARRQLVRGGIPPVPTHEEKCSVCLHQNRCFGAQRVDHLAPLAVPSGILGRRLGDLRHAGRAGFLGVSSRPLPTPTARSTGLATGCRSVGEVTAPRASRQVRHAARSPDLRSTTAKGVRAARRHEAGADGPATHETYFAGSRVEPSPWPGCLYVVGSDGVVPWVYVGQATATTERDVADRCFGAVRETGLPCHQAVRFDQNGTTSPFPFGEEDRKQWASQLVVRESRPAPEDAVQVDPTPTRPASATVRNEPPEPPSSRGDVGGAPSYVGCIAEDRTKPLRFAMRGDRVFGYVLEDHRASLAKEDFVVAERTSGDAPSKRVFLRVLEITSSPRSAAIRTKSINELDTQLLLEPLAEHHPGEDRPRPVANDDLNGYKLRRATAEEVRTFVGLPTTGWPLGRLAANGEPVTVNFPFEPRDALFRSFFVVGAKGQGEDELRPIAIHARDGLPWRPIDERPAVVILDGEPSPKGLGSEFGPATFHSAHKRLGEQIGATLLDRPAVQEIILTRDESGLAFSYGDIKVEDILLLLPSLTETSANVLRRILKLMAEQRETPLRSLKDALEHLRREVQGNGQVDGRTARAIAERLASPQVEILEQCVPDAVGVPDLLKPGTITVLNVVDLDEDQRKVVALYLLLAFEKLAEQRGGINALLVLDEGEKLFPRRHGGHATPTTIQRLAGRIGGIARRGRRRLFGMMVCTQSPSDVHREIVANCDIKMTFNVTGQDGWLRENLGPDLVQGVKALETGECYVDLRKVVAGVTKPVKTRLFAT